MSQALAVYGKDSIEFVHKVLQYYCRVDPGAKIKVVYRREWSFHTEQGSQSGNGNDLAFLCDVDIKVLPHLFRVEQMQFRVKESFSLKCLKCITWILSIKTN